VSREALLDVAGTLRAAYEDVDWAATPLGPMASWSPALRTTADLALQTHFPVALFWGPEFVLVYNAAYVELIADKHPAALGTPARDVFPEAWDTIGPMMQAVLAGEGATWVEDAPVPLHRHGLLEEAYFTFSYSPVRGEDGTIEGVLDIATETTRNVIDRRRLATLGRLREVLADLERAEDLPDRVLPVLRADAADLPRVDLHLGAAAPTAAARDGEVVVEASAEGRTARVALGPARDLAARPVLVVGLSARLAPDEAYLGFLRLIAAAIGQALDRIAAREAERGIAEALQRSLLTRPPQSDDLEVAVRYLPAAEGAQVGGDWYDAFLDPDGALTLVVGDVTGHDRMAAAAMAQVRNLLRGVCSTLRASPARQLATLDQAMLGLSVGVLATAVLARVEEEPGGERPRRTLRWSNAGHPPPVLLAPDGRARLLEETPNPLLGLGADPRGDHAVALEPGAILVLYTDGLVERRRAGLQEGLEWLVGVLEERQGLGAEELSDLLLAQLEPHVEDDVALLVLRVGE